MGLFGIDSGEVPLLSKYCKAGGNLEASSRMPLIQGRVNCSRLLLMNIHLVCYQRTNDEAATTCLCKSVPVLQSFNIKIIFPMFKSTISCPIHNKHREYISPQLFVAAFYIFEDCPGPSFLDNIILSYAQRPHFFSYLCFHVMFSRILIIFMALLQPLNIQHQTQCPS